MTAGTRVVHKRQPRVERSPYFLAVKSSTELLVSKREALALLHTSRLEVGVKKRGRAKLRRGGCCQRREAVLCTETEPPTRARGGCSLPRHRQGKLGGSKAEGGARQGRDQLGVASRAGSGPTAGERRRGGPAGLCPAARGGASPHSPAATETSPGTGLVRRFSSGK